MLSEEQLSSIRAQAGKHASLGQPPPVDEEQLTYYGCLELIDFHCISKYGDAPEGVLEEDVKAYLVEHKERIKGEAIPSYLGFLAGNFDFLR